MNGDMAPCAKKAQVDIDLKVDLSRTSALLFKACSTCNASVLKQVLETHERFCHGATDRRVNPQPTPLLMMLAGILRI